MPPFQGQGMNSGIRDAANLAWKLSLVLRGYAVDSILSSYEPERRSNLKQVTDDSIKLGKVVIVPNPLKAYVRDKLLEWSILLRGLAPSIWDGIQFRLFPPPPHIISEASLLADGAGQDIAGNLSPCPDVVMAGADRREVPLDTVTAPTGFTLIFCASKGADALHRVFSASDGSLAFLRNIGTWAAAVAPLEPDGNFDGGSAGEGDKPVIEGLVSGGRCRDLHGRWTSWVRTHGLEDRLLLVRPDKYVFGAFDDVDSAARHLARSLGTPAELGPASAVSSTGRGGPLGASSAEL